MQVDDGLVCCPFCLSTDPNKVGIERATGKACRDAFHCPIPETHGNPFRFCEHCAWNEDNDGRMPGQNDLQQCPRCGSDNIESSGIGQDRTVHCTDCDSFT